VSPGYEVSLLSHLRCTGSVGGRGCLLGPDSPTAAGYKHHTRGHFAPRNFEFEVDPNDSIILDADAEGRWDGIESINYLFHFTVSATAESLRTNRQAELDEAGDRWDAVALTAYSFEFSESCFC
jgi:hypothetical protein